ncbi:MAG TPA: hypothetical protein VGM27_25755 [Acidobacteriaceae bacterium]
MGKTVSIKVTIYRFSTPDERQVLVAAFKKGQNQSLVTALTKMKAVGRIAITGTLGYDLSYIALTQLHRPDSYPNRPQDSIRD